VGAVSGAPIDLVPVGGESTSARLRRTEAELGSALTQLNRVTKLHDELAERYAELLTKVMTTRLPVTDDEVRAWYADRGLNMSCGAGVLFAALRKEYGFGASS
jgi:hypothetical protein